MPRQQSTMPCLALLGACILARVSTAAAGGGFLAERGLAAACTPSGQACQKGVDCCGVCAYIGADTWSCVDCTPPGDECIPMGNRCCDGGNKLKDTPLSNPGHVCRATNELSEQYGITKYTCQAAHVSFAANATGKTTGLGSEPEDQVSVGESRGSHGVQSKQECLADGAACEAGVDCCGVCVFIERASECRTCVPPGGECSSPYSNPCCGGATKRYDQGIVDPAYTCQAAGHLGGEWGVQKFTCQAAKR